MGVGDRAADLAGKAKEGLGDATDNRDLEAERKAEESKAEWIPPVTTSLTRRGTSTGQSRSTTSGSSASCALDTAVTTLGLTLG
jgi:hypothetical protein